MPANKTRASLRQTSRVRYRGRKPASTHEIATTFAKYQRSGITVNVESSSAAAMNAANGNMQAAVQSSSKGVDTILPRLNQDTDVETPIIAKAKIENVSQPA